jgi:chemotaxis protein CheD
VTAVKTPITSRRLHVGQGEHHVSGEPDLLLSTILGSCVAACLRDERIAVGGMNHFLLPESGGNSSDPAAASRYGAHAMELLINSILRAGGRRENMTAKVFGGARMFDDLQNIGGNNAAFAEKFLRDEGIPIVSSCLGGRSARRIHYWPATGKAMVRAVEDAEGIEKAERKKVREAAQVTGGSVELF